MSEFDLTIDDVTGLAHDIVGRVAVNAAYANTFDGKMRLSTVDDLLIRRLQIVSDLLDPPLDYDSDAEYIIGSSNSNLALYLPSAFVWMLDSEYLVEAVVQSEDVQRERRIREITIEIGGQQVPVLEEQNAGYVTLTADVMAHPALQFFEIFEAQKAYLERNYAPLIQQVLLSETRTK